MTSEGILTWAKRVEVQQAQAAIVSDITESQKFNKLKLAQKPKTKWDMKTTHPTYHKWPCRYCGGNHVPRKCLACGKMCMRCGKMGHFKKVCRSMRDHMAHGVEMEMAQAPQEEVRETVSNNSVYLNRNQLLITVQLEKQVGKTILEAPYKIDTGNEDNLMPLYIFKRVFKNMSVEQLKGSIKET